MFSHSEIRALLPHRHPMLLVDRITDLKKWTEVTGTKTVSGTEACYATMADGDDARDYAYPCSLILESFGQVGGVLVNLKRAQSGIADNKIMLASGVTAFHFFGDVYPGDTMVHRLVLDKDLDDFAVLSGEMSVNGRKLAQAEAMIVAYREAGVIRFGSHV
jgi:3-hydroxyacyl-[acyl-carrier-protein] dehydratase